MSNAKGLRLVKLQLSQLHGGHSPSRTCLNCGQSTTHLLHSMNCPFIDHVIAHKFMEIQGVLQDHNLPYSVEEVIQFPHYIIDSILFQQVALLLDQLFVLILEEIKSRWIIRRRESFRTMKNQTALEFGLRDIIK